MPLLTAGRDFYVSRLHGNTAQALDSTHSYIAVGDSAAAFNAAQTDLQASTNKVRKLVSNGYPTLFGNAATYVVTFDENEANFTWQEWGIANADTGGTLLNRKVAFLGVKTNTQQWVVTITLTTNAT